MNLYTYKAPKLVRVYIRKQGEESFYLNFENTTQQEVYKFIEGIILKQTISPFEKGKVTACDIRKYEEGTFVEKSMCLSFKGINPKQLHELILKELK